METRYGLKFAPQLAVQAAADTGYVWANCFISRKENSPWFRLEFKLVTSIFNVRLGVRNQGGGLLPPDFSLQGMTGLSVSVSNSSRYESFDNTCCGCPWAYRATKSIDVTCWRKLSGRYVHVIVLSSSPTYLMICSIVINKADGTVSSLVAQVIQEIKVQYSQLVVDLHGVKLIELCRMKFTVANDYKTVTIDSYALTLQTMKVFYNYISSFQRC